MKDLEIAVVAGDGIGVEVMESALTVLDVLEQRFGFKLRRRPVAAGAGYYRDHGVDIEPGGMEACKTADAILFGAIGLPNVRKPDGTEIAPHLQMRAEMGLFAGVRPVRRMPHTPSPLADSRAEAIDLIVLRESTEGLFASVGKGTVENDEVARDTLEITRTTSERLFDFAFGLARTRKARGRSKGLVTCVDKANVFVSMAFFRKIFDERAARFPDVQKGYSYVDAAALDLVRKPWAFDVMVMENMFGDILSDLGGGLVGGMGMAPCAEIGLEHALFQPAHGTAPDIAGRGIANPTAMLLSTAMMLDWLAERHGAARLSEAAAALDASVVRSFADRAALPMELGGGADCATVTRAVIERVG